MADTRPIVFGPGAKLRWLEAIAADRRSKGLDVRIAIGISSRIEIHTGCAPIAQLWLASFAGASERGVRAAAEHLETMGHLSIDRAPAGASAFGGRGKANVYRPIAPTKTDRNPELQCRVLPTETRQLSAIKPAILSRKPGTAVPPLPCKSLDSSCPHPTSISYQHPTSISYPNPRSISYPHSTSIGDPNERRWQAVREDLAKRIGAEITANWFDQLAVSVITDCEVIMIAPNAFVRHRIENTCLWDRLHEAWRRASPAIARVQIVDAIRRAAE